MIKGRLGFFVLLVLTVFAVGCGHGDDSSNNPAGVTPIGTSKPTVSITCNGVKDSCSVANGASPTIAWSSTDATSCSVSPSGWTGTTGSQSTGPLTTSVDYKADCRNSSGDSASATVRVNVAAPLPPGSFSLSGTCSVVDGGNQRASLSWTPSANATSYQVNRHAWTSGVWSSVGTTGNTSFSQVVQNDADFYWQVVAVNLAGEKVSTPEEILVCASVVRPPVTPPGPINGPGNPELIFTSIPPKGSFNNLIGRALHVIPTDYKVAVYIKVGGWWTKPTFASPLTVIASDGYWLCDITTGGSDETATEIAAFLVVNGYNPPAAGGSGSLPITVDGLNVVASAHVNR